MIEGRVSKRHAFVPLIVRGPAGQGEAEFLIDTGFAGYITLPRAAILKLALDYRGPQHAFLAEGSPVLLDVYELTIVWHGVERAVEIYEMDSPPLLGMALLDGSDIHIQAVEGGSVIIEQF